MYLTSNTQFGLGSHQAKLQVFIANRPPLDFYQGLHSMHCLTKGEIKDIADKTGNHWRKVFNVYSKFLFELQPSLQDKYKTWQSFREEALLQANADHSLLFSSFTKFDSVENSNLRSSLNTLNSETRPIKIIMGKAYGQTQLAAVNVDLNWLNDYFAINKRERVIVCPYFDYRQLSNQKITDLIKLVKTL